MARGSGDHRNTPESVLRPVWAMGEIDLDPCSNAYSIVNAKTSYDLSRGQDGLVLPWFGTVFVNGPWSKLRPWAKRSVNEWGIEVFFWCPIYPETKWSKALWTAKPTVCLWGKRVNHPNRSEMGAGTKWPTMMVYVGDRSDEFAEVFKPYGTIAQIC